MAGVLNVKGDVTLLPSLSGSLDIRTFIGMTYQYCNFIRLGLVIAFT